MLHTPSENIKQVHSLSVAITAAATNGAAADCLGFEDALVTVYGAPTGTGTTGDFTVEDSADNSSFAAISGAVFTQMTTVGGAKLYVGNVKCSKNRRYLRAVFTGAGGSAAGTAYATITLLNARRKPVAQANTVVFSV